MRAELANLEEEGFLTHPHTSAGRVPTDTGYRFYVERLLAQQDRLPQPVADELGISKMRREVDVAIRETTTTLSQITDLVALVTAPPLHTATIHRIEVLRLQPKVVMVVVIASNGGVTKRVFTFDFGGRPRARRVGRELSEREARRTRPGCSDGGGPRTGSRAWTEGDGVPG